jgi:hypothetical protein
MTLSSSSVSGLPVAAAACCVAALADALAGKSETADITARISLPLNWLTP